MAKTHPPYLLGAKEYPSIKVGEEFKAISNDVACCLGAKFPTPRPSLLNRWASVLFTWNIMRAKVARDTVS
jgi:hypothetical protein